MRSISYLIDTLAGVLFCVQKIILLEVGMRGYKGPRSMITSQNAVNASVNSSTSSR